MPSVKGILHDGRTSQRLTTKIQFIAVTTGFASANAVIRPAFKEVYSSIDGSFNVRLNAGRYVVKCGGITLTEIIVPSGEGTYGIDALIATGTVAPASGNFLQLTGGTMTGDIIMSHLTAGRAAQIDSAGRIAASAVTDAELGHLSGVTSSVQTQIDGKLSLSGGTMTGALSLSGSPSASLHAASKGYVDSVSQGVSPKEPVACASTANLTLSGEQTIDGVSTSASRVLVKNQSTASQNGIYVSAAGAWSRAADMDAWDETVGAFIFVSGGTTQASTGWASTTETGGTIGTTAVTFVQMSAPGAYTAGSGLTLAGNQFSLTPLTASQLGSGTANSGTFLRGDQTWTNRLTGPLTVDGAITFGTVISGQLVSFTGNLDIRDNGSIVSLILADGSYIQGGGLLNLEASPIRLSGHTASRALALNSNKDLVSSATTATELGYLSGVTSAIQTQLDGKQPLDATLTALSGVSTAADRIAYFTGAGTATHTSLTSAARTVLDDITTDSMITTLGGASYTGTGGLVRLDSPRLTTNIELYRAAASSNGPFFEFIKRGTSGDVNAPPGINGNLGHVSFQGWDGSTELEGAAIYAKSLGFSSGSASAFLDFQTSNAASGASSALWIYHDRSLHLFNTTATPSGGGDQTVVYSADVAGAGTSGLNVLDESGALLLIGNGGQIKTANPTSGTADWWRFGSKVSAVVTLVTTDYLQVSVGGTAYKIALVA